MSPLIKPVGLIGGTLLLLLIGRKSEAATLPPVEPPVPPPTPPTPKPPAPKPTPTGKIPLGTAGDFAPGTLLGVVTANGVNLRASATETSASMGTMDRGTILELFPDGHRPPTAAAPQGWEAARAANGVQGFVSAQLLSGKGVPRGPIEQPVEQPLGPVELPPELAPQGGGGAPFNPGGVDLTPILTGENAPKDGGIFEPFNLAPLFAGAPPGWFSPMIGARAPAYGQAQFGRPLGKPQTHGLVFSETPSVMLPPSEFVRAQLDYARQAGMSPSVLRVLEFRYAESLVREGKAGGAVAATASPSGMRG